MRTSQPIAFVDVETTGLSPTQDRVAEIGVITVDGGRVDSWTTFLASPRHAGRRSAAEPTHSGAPTFRDVARTWRGVSTHLFVAHNARFDHGFIKAEFARLGIEFHPEVLCSVMLSQAAPAAKLPRPRCARRGARSAAGRVAPRAAGRGHAMAMVAGDSREFPAHVIDQAVSELLAGPVLPPPRPRADRGLA
jgi:DNA polymerase-3 subunit epsilon